MDAEWTEAWRQARDALLSQDIVVRIGSNDEGPELFGAVTDAAFDAGGNIYVMDASSQEVRVFDPLGKHLGTLGGRGDGPDELRNATRVAIMPDGRLLIPTPRRIQIFAQHTGEWRLDETREVEINASSVCLDDNGKWYFWGWRRADNTIVQRIAGPSHDEVTSLGSGYNDKEWLVQWRMADNGEVACARHPESVVAAFGVLPLVRSYSVDGNLRWVANIQELKPMQAVSGSTEDGRPFVRRLRHLEHDLLGSATYLSTGHVLMQYYRIRNRKRSSTPRSYLLDANSGIGAFVSDALPLIVDIRDGRYIAVFADPYPLVEVVETRLPKRASG